MGEARSHRPWPADERAWAKECFLAGDTLEEIADAAGRQLADVRQQLGTGRSLTPIQREILSLYAAGCTFAEIDRERGKVGGHPGAAAGACVRNLRSRGMAIPYRNKVSPEGSGHA